MARSGTRHCKTKATCTQEEHRTWPAAARVPCVLSPSDSGLKRLCAHFDAGFPLTLYHRLVFKVRSVAPTFFPQLQVLLSQQLIFFLPFFSTCCSTPSSGATTQLALDCHVSEAHTTDGRFPPVWLPEFSGLLSFLCVGSAIGSCCPSSVPHS